MSNRSTPVTYEANGQTFARCPEHGGGGFHVNYVAFCIEHVYDPCSVGSVARYTGHLKAIEQQAGYVAFCLVHEFDPSDTSKVPLYDEHLRITARRAVERAKVIERSRELSAIARNDPPSHWGY